VDNAFLDMGFWKADSMASEIPERLSTAGSIRKTVETPNL